LKNSDTKFNGYISKFYTLTKSFNEKPILLVSCVKKTIFCVKNTWHFYVVFTQVTKKYRFLQNMIYPHIMSIRKREISVRFLFFTFRNIFSSGRSIYSHVPNWISTEYTTTGLHLRNPDDKTYSWSLFWCSKTKFLLCTDSDSLQPCNC
jgi:hypothetical protein